MKQLLLLVNLLIAVAAIAQETAFTAAKSVTGEYVDFTVDNLGNYFLLSKNNQLKKLNANGDSVAVFNDVRRYGKLHSIDVANPLKVLL